MNLRLLAGWKTRLHALCLCALVSMMAVTAAAAQAQEAAAPVTSEVPLASTTAAEAVAEPVAAAVDAAEAVAEKPAAADPVVEKGDVAWMLTSTLLVLRYYLSTHRVPELGKAVMLSPPNQGSEVADALAGSTIYGRINGPAGAQLVTGPDGLPAQLGPVDFTLGIITGNEHTAVDALLATQIPGENDGKVSVERAKVKGMRDFLVLPVTHTFIVNNDVVIGQTLHFLKHGNFLHEVVH